MINKNGDLTYKIKYCAYNNTIQSECGDAILRDTLLKVSNWNERTIYFIRVTPVNKAGQQGPIMTLFYRTPYGN